TVRRIIVEQEPHHNFQARHSSCVAWLSAAFRGVNVYEYGVRSLKIIERGGGNMCGFWRRMRAVIATGLLAALLVPAGSLAQAQQTTLRFIPQADLRSIDPVWTTAYVTRNFGYMVFDTLFALDKDLKPQAQMVDHWTKSDDQLTWRFTLRDGLKWHDGQLVRAADCVASIER